jgi:hypothetical protein
MIKSVNVYFILPIFLWFLHLALVIKNINILIFNSYLDDLLVLPIILGVSLVIQQNLIANKSFTFNIKTLVYCWLYFSITFEIIVPIFNKHFTADWKDSIAYAIGGIYFYIFQNKPTK